MAPCQQEWGLIQRRLADKCGGSGDDKDNVMEMTVGIPENVAWEEVETTPTLFSGVSLGQGFH